MITRAKILNHLAQVNHPGFTGDCIRLFVHTADTKTDKEVIQLVLDLQSQIKDNRAAMKNCLGKQYDFINSFKLTPAAKHPRLVFG